MKRFLLIIMSGMFLASCSGVPLKLNELKEVPKKKEERYTLIYFVGTEHRDIRRAVVLDIEDDAYRFKLTVEDFQYEILQTIDILESLYEAEIFFRHEGTEGYKKSAILSPEGYVVGYELRPMFVKDFMGVEDLMDLSYKLNEKTGEISIKIKLRASLSRIVY